MKYQIREIIKNRLVRNIVQKPFQYRKPTDVFGMTIYFVTPLERKQAKAALNKHNAIHAIDSLDNSLYVMVNQEMIDDIRVAIVTIECILEKCDSD